MTDQPTTPALTHREELAAIAGYGEGYLAALQATRPTDSNEERRTISAGAMWNLMASTIRRRAVASSVASTLTTMQTLGTGPVHVVQADSPLTDTDRATISRAWSEHLRGDLS